MPSFASNGPIVLFLALNSCCFYANKFNTFLLFSKQIKEDVIKVFIF